MRYSAGIIAGLLLATVLVPCVYGQRQLALDHVDGLAGPGQVYAEKPITFHIRLTFIDGTKSILGFRNGFRVYSSDGATWQPITWDVADLDWDSMFDLVFSQYAYGVTGSGADTLGFAGNVMLGPGLTSPFDEVVWSISTQLSASQQGKHICIDSSYFPPSGTWLWAPVGPPDWSGPHCFEVVLRDIVCGDIDGNGSEPDISDLTFLVDYFFGGGDPPPEFEAADVDNSDTLDISDLTYMVNYLFGGGPPPVC